MSALDVVTIGETMLRFSPPETASLEEADIYRVHVAGSESNLAVALARLGLRTAWVSRLSDSPLGRKIAHRIREHGVDVSRVIWTPEGRVGLYFLEVGPAPRVSHLLYDRRDSAFTGMKVDEVDWEFIAQARIIHLTGITPALGPGARELARHAILRARRAGQRISFDVNYRSKLWSPAEARTVLEDLLPGVDLLFCRLDDAETLFGLTGSAEDVAAGLARRFSTPLVVMTLGVDGSLAWDEGRNYRQPSIPAEVVDPIGRGDAFAAGFLYGWLVSGVPEGLRYGSAVAALKQTYVGDLVWFSFAEVEAVVQGAKGGIRR